MGPHPGPLQGAESLVTSSELRTSECALVSSCHGCANEPAQGHALSSTSYFRNVDIFPAMKSPPRAPTLLERPSVPQEPEPEPEIQVFSLYSRAL